MTDDQVKHIYTTDYWHKCRCDDLPDGVDYVVFDQAVNSGPGQSARWLQAAVGVPADGGIGPQTIAAARQGAPAQIINAMCDARLAFLRRLRGGTLWETFGRGWQARVDGVRAYGLRLAAGAAAATDSGAAVEDGGRLPSVDYEIVRRGSRGAWVETLQEALGLTVDGIFGPGTEAALKAYQKEAGLTADGVAGRKTYQALGLIA
jgi:lysozyme family protein